MGKAVPKNIKQKVRELLLLFPEQFSRDYAQNKQFLKTLNLPFSKTTINLIVGFITRKKGDAI